MRRYKVLHIKTKKNVSKQGREILLPQLIHTFYYKKSPKYIMSYQMRSSIEKSEHCQFTNLSKPAP